MPGHERLDALPDFLTPLKEAASRYLKYPSVMGKNGVMDIGYRPWVAELNYMLMMNASLAVFNLMPFPPLDGSKVLYSILPSSMEPVLNALERFGYVILLVAVYFGVFGAIFRPVEILIYRVLLGI